MAASGVRARLGRAFLLQAVFIGAAAVVGVFLASLLLEGVLIRQALSEESAHFWEQHERDPAACDGAGVGGKRELGAERSVIHGVRASQHVLKQAHVLDGAGEATVVAVGVEVKRRLDRDATVRCLEADDAVEGGGDAD